MAANAGGGPFSMWFVRRIFFLSLVIAAFATSGQAVTLDCNSIAWIGALSARGINPTWTAVGSCILATALILGHSAKFRK